MKRVLFVRHGQGAHNRSIANWGMVDPELTSEGEAQVERILAEAPELEIAEISDIWHDVIGGDNCPQTQDGMLRLLPGRDGTDGFFMAVLQSRLR